MVVPSRTGEVGIGFFIHGKDQNTRFGHNGADEGFLTKATFYKSLGKGAVIMINSLEGGPMMDEIERAIAREYGWPGYFDDEQKKITLDQKALAPLLGKYISKSDMKFDVKEIDGHLALVFDKQVPLELVATSETQFYVDGLNSEISFEKVNGKVKSLTVQQEGNSILAEKKN